MNPRYVERPAPWPHLDFQSASKRHAELGVVVLGEDSLEGLLEERRVEGVAHHDVASTDTDTDNSSSISVCSKGLHIRSNLQRRSICARGGIKPSHSTGQNVREARLLHI